MPSEMMEMLHMRKWWRVGIFLWSLAAVCIVYTAFSHVGINRERRKGKQEQRLTRLFPNTLVTFQSVQTYSGPTDVDLTAYPNTTVEAPLTPGTGRLFLTLRGLHSGRLGNQMFMYASLLGIARTLQREPFISPGYSLDVAFKLRHLAEIPESEKWPIVEQTHYAMFEKTLLDNLASMTSLHRNLSLSGYFQSWIYFKDITDEIRKEFTFRTSVIRQRDQILRTSLQIPRNEAVLVGVHVRRADLISKRSTAIGYTIPNRSYFLKAFDWMRKKLYGEKVVFLIVSDDFIWCDNHLRGSDVIVIPPRPYMVHLALLANCDHVIFSTGTFGWWGAWLAGGYTVYYNNFPSKGSNLSIGFSRDDFYPAHWVAIGD